MLQVHNWLYSIELYYIFYSRTQEYDFRRPPDIDLSTMSQYNCLYYTFNATTIKKMVEARKVINKHEIVKYNFKSLTIKYQK